MPLRDASFGLQGEASRLCACDGSSVRDTAAAAVPPVGICQPALSFAAGGMLLPAGLQTYGQPAQQAAARITGGRNGRRAFLQPRQPQELPGYTRRRDQPQASAGSPFPRGDSRYCRRRNVRCIFFHFFSVLSENEPSSALTAPLQHAILTALYFAALQSTKGRR